VAEDFRLRRYVTQHAIDKLDTELHSVRIWNVIEGPMYCAGQVKGDAISSIGRPQRLGNGLEVGRKLCQ
jgi:hypothetical protein